MLRKLAIAAGALLAALALAPTPADAESGGTAPRRAKAHHPFRGNGMWIWYVSASSHGNWSKIAHKARRHNIRTLYVKSSDGSYAWQQFTRSFVSFMHRHHVQVCGWQYVYGDHPGREAARGAEAVKKGADCLVIDAESQYEGRYSRADRYVSGLRRRIGRRFPVGLASFPYVDYHPALPYSVFLGRKGAQYNLPQLYWYTIGTTVAQGYLHTFTYNRVYRRPIMPLGQTYADPPIHQIKDFKRYANAYGFNGVSWWDWQETSRREWRALGRRVGGVAGFDRPRSAFPYLHKGSRGDLVVWAQEHLRAAHRHVPVTGYFGHRTVRAVRHFQADHGLTPDGQISTATWRKLLRYRAVWVDWSGKARSGKGPARGEPRSATLPAIHNEIPPPSAR